MASISSLRTKHPTNTSNSLVEDSTKDQLQTQTITGIYSTRFLTLSRWYALDESLWYLLKLLLIWKGILKNLKRKKEKRKGWQWNGNKTSAWFGCWSFCHYIKILVLFCKLIIFFGIKNLRMSWISPCHNIFEPTIGVILFNNGVISDFKNNPTKIFPSIVLVTTSGQWLQQQPSKFLHCTILVTRSANNFFQKTFNLKWNMYKNHWCCFQFREGFAGPPWKNVMVMPSMIYFQPFRNLLLCLASNIPSKLHHSYMVWINYWYGWWLTSTWVSSCK
jgi:hypothetical protein